jgi:hypothetical protein
LGALAAPFVPLPKVTHIPSNAFAYFTGDGAELGRIPVRKIMARVRLTEEVLKDHTPGAFSEFMRRDFDQLARDIQTREEQAMARTEVPRSGSVVSAKQEHDWSADDDWDDEDY